MDKLMPKATDEGRSGGIVRTALLSISTALIVVVAGLGVVLLIQLAEWREHPENLSKGFDSILLTHFRAVIGLPAAAAEQLPIEIFLISGDRLRIAPGTDAATLRTLLNVLRERA
jgi:hypothetical protein